MDQLAKGIEPDEEEIYDGSKEEDSIDYPTSGQLAMQPEVKQTNSIKTVDTGRNVVNAQSQFGKGNSEVIICEPHEYKESATFVGHLQSKKTIIVNLNLLEAADAIRLVDFLCGATYALGGNQRKISENVFIFTPMSVSLSAEAQEDKMVKDFHWT
jgi:cell division inhibitor SepF